MLSRHRIIHLIFIVATFAFSLAIWIQFKNGLSLFAWRDMLLMLGLSIFAIALFFLSAFVFSSKEIMVVFVAFLAGFLAVFAPERESWLGAFLALLLLFYAQRRMASSIQNRLKASFYPLLLFGGSSMITAMAILFGFAGYFYPIDLERLQFKGNSLDRLVSLAEPFIGPRIPGYQKGITVDGLLKSNINSSIDQSLVGITGAIPAGSLPFAIPSQALQGIKTSQALIDKEIQNELNKQKTELGKKLGIEITGKETFAELVSSLFNSYINRYLSPYKEFLPLVVAVSVFLTFKSFGFFVNRFALLIAWILSQILMAANVIKKQTATVEKEILSIS